MTVHLQLGAATATLQGIQARVFAGRDPAACQLAVTDPTLSRRHAEIFVDQGQVYIHDLGSANGTWVDGAPLEQQAVAIRPGQQIWLGHVPLGVTWEADGSATVMAQDVPAELKALMAQKQAQIPQATPSTSTPLPADYAYRRQGSNDNGVVLLALRQDTFFNGGNIDGYIEFTSLDHQNVASIIVELVEIHKGKPHAWDRFLVRQGPWKAAHGDVLPLPFTLRVPPGTAMSARDVAWEIKATVDINWAVDIHASIPITMRNQDIERLRDALGAMDFRVVDIVSTALGQHFEGTFQPPAQLAKQMGVNEVRMTVEYLGANLKLRLLVDRKGLHHDHALDQVFELGRLRAASQPEINATIEAMLRQLLPQSS